MIRKLVPALAVALVFGFQLTALAQVKLQYKFLDGARSTTWTDVKTDQVLVLSGMEIVTGAHQQLTTTRVHGKRSADGALRIVEKIASIKTKTSLPGGVEIEFDSEKPDAAPPGTQFDVLIDIFKALAGSSWTTVYDKDNRVVAVEGRDKALDSLDDSVKATLKKQFDPLYLKTQANDHLDRIPAGPVAKGDTWERTETVRLEAGQNMTFKTVYEYQGTVEQSGKVLDQISSKNTEVTYTIDADSPTPLRLVNSELKIAASEGRLLFDRQLGQVVQSREKVQIKGPLTFDVNGTELPGQLDLTMETSTVTK